MRRHIVFARELFETIWTWIDFDVALMRCDIVTAEITDVSVNAWAHLASICVITFFGTKVPNRTLWIIDNVFARTVAGIGALNFQIVIFAERWCYAARRYRCGDKGRIIIAGRNAVIIIFAGAVCFRTAAAAALNGRRAGFYCIGGG